MLPLDNKSVLLHGNYRAEVVSNSDSGQKGRIRVRVHPYFTDIETQYLPWAVPAMPLFSGAGSGYGSMCIPEVGSWVWVFFEAGDVHQPVYFAEAQSGVHGIPSEAATGYPDNKVFKTPNGLILSFDDSSKKITITHPEGTTILVDSDGKIDIQVDDSDIDVTAALGDINIKTTVGTINLNPVVP